MKTKAVITAPAHDDSATDAQIERWEARKAEKARRDGIRANPGLAHEELTLVRVGPPVPLANILRASEHALPEDVVKIPAGALLWPGAVVRLPVGFIVPDFGSKSPTDPVLFRDARADEVEDLVTVQLAAGYLEAKARAGSSASLLIDTKAEKERRAALVEKKRKELADVESFDADGAKMLASAERHAAFEAEAFEKWVAECGRPEDAVKAAADLMMRAPSAEQEREPEGAYIVTSGGRKVYAKADRSTERPARLTEAQIASAS